MKSFSAEGIEYYLLRCPVCGFTFRHDISVTSLGKPLVARACIVCGNVVKIDDENCLDVDFSATSFDVAFKPANDI